MSDNEKGKEELIGELNELRRKNAELENSLLKSRKTASKYLGTLKEMERQIHSIYKNLPLAYQLLDDKGRLIRVNSAWLNFFGYSRDEVLDRFFSDFLAPDCQIIFNDIFARFLEEGETGGIELDALKKNGDPATISLVGLVNRDRSGRSRRTHCILHDVTARKKADKELPEEKERFRITLQSIGEGVITTDINGKVVLINRVAQELTGWNRQQAEGKSLEAVFMTVNEDHSERIENPAHKILSSGKMSSFTSGAILISKTGEERIIEESSAPIRSSDGMVSGVVITFRDVTEHRNAERKLLGEIKIKAALSELYEPIVWPFSSMQDIGRAVLDKARDITQSEHGYVSLIDPETHDNVINGSTGISSNCTETDGLQMRISRDENGKYPGLLGHGLNTCLPFYSNDPGSMDIYEGVPEGHAPIKRFLSVPVRIGKELVGQIALANAPRDYTALDLETISRFARYYSLAILRKRVENAFLEAEKRYRILFESAGDSIITIDAEDASFGRIIAANPAAAQTHGYSLSEMSGLSIYDLNDPEEGQITAERLRRLLKSGWMKEEIYHRRKDGTKFPIEINAGVLKTGKQKFILALGRDTTERKQTEAVLIQNERLRAIGDLAAGVAHNFNNLLQVISGGCQMAAIHFESGNFDEGKWALDHALESVRVGAETVRRLQSFASLRESTQAGTTIFDLSQIILQAMEMSRPWWKSLTEKQGISITMSHDLLERCFIRGDENEMFEVALILIKNAVEAMPEGGNIRIESCISEDNVVFTVKDDGTGIPEENLARIFQPFFTTKGFQGTGMGLASAYGIIKRHDGLIAAENINNGTIITVKLPLWKNQHRPHRPNHGPDGSPLRLLLVDDMDSVLKTLEHGLTGCGHKVMTAASGAEALEIFDRTHVDAVLCDLGMPGMNGWEVGSGIRRICESKGTAKVPFLLVTGWGGQIDEREKILQSGVDRILEKPVDLVHLLKAIYELVGR